MLLKGRTALITGAAQGIGLARESISADGASVILADIKEDAVIHAAKDWQHSMGRIR